MIPRLIFALAFTWIALAQNTKYAPLPPFPVPDSVEARFVDIYSEGTRMSGQLYYAKANSGKKLPTILLAHGWGGVAASLRREAVAFAQAGYLALAFDYRGWGLSDSRVILVNKSAPTEKHNGRFMAEVLEVREVVDPLDMIVDWQNALAFVVGEPMCDANRLGLWGSSLSGGLVVSVAVREPRVKALHSQVPGLGGEWTVANQQQREMTLSESTKRARGELGYPPPGANTVAHLIGAPIRFKFASWSPVEEIERIPKCATQFVIAGKEELVDNKTNGIAAYEHARGPKNLVTIPDIDHYGIYYILPARERSRDLAIAWFDKYVKAVR
ncbi:MAG TPA: acetylxylan esterase [Bryobacteraceae bacterium]|jgi:dienelactone hydrolase